MYNKYLKHPIVRTVHYLINKEFPGCNISFYDDDSGIEMMVFSFSEEKRKEYRLSKMHEEFQILNNRLTGTNLLNPFTYDPLVRRIEEIEIEMEIAKQKKVSENTKRVLKEAKSFCENEKISVKEIKDPESAVKIFKISFILYGERRYYSLKAEEDCLPSHMKKESEELLDQYNTVSFLDLPPGLKFMVLHTAFPGLKSDAVEYMCGIKLEDKDGWKTPEDAYVKPYQRKLYHLFGVGSLDILYDNYDGIQVGEYVDNKMRHIVLLDTSSETGITEYAYRTTINWIGEEVLERIPYADYLSKRNEIIDRYKAEVMKVYKETGTPPMIAIDYMNENENPNNGYLLMNTDKAIQLIRRKKLEDPMFDVIKRQEKTIETHNKQYSVGINVKIDKEDPSLRTISYSENGRIGKVDIDLRNLSISELYSNRIRKEEKAKHISGFSLTLLDMLTTDLPKIKGTIEYKNFLLQMRLADIGIVADGLVENEAAMYYKLKDHRIWINPYTHTTGEEIRGSLIEDERVQYENVRNIYIELFK